jgi:hypothetical protein
MASILRKFSRVLLPAIIATSALVVGVAPAHAHDCGGPYLHAVSPVARADFVWDPWCSDGRAFIGYGSVEDTSCDGRSAIVRFDVYDRTASGDRWLWNSPTFQATNGCGNWASFPDQRPPSPGTTGWRLRVLLKACNSASCSSLYSVNFYG